MSSQFRSEKEETILELILERLVAITSITSAPEGKSVTEIDFTYDVDGDIETIVFKEVAEALFTLTFTYDANKNLTSITRS